jgi:hypothetical protein
MMAGYIDCLLSPASYDEVKGVHQALKMLWPVLFPEYSLVDRPNRMPATWQPDLIGLRDNEVLLIEVKAHGGKRKQEAVKQVARYGVQFHAEYPTLGVRLLAIGPWHTQGWIDTVDCEGYSVGVMDIREMGRNLTLQAERLLLAYSYLKSAERGLPLGIGKSLDPNVLESESDDGISAAQQG